MSDYAELRDLAVRRFSAFVWGVYHLRVRYAFSVTSWGRTTQRNKAMGGRADSQHLTFTAADIVFEPGAEPNPGELKAVAREMALEAHQEADHWHLELVTNLYL